MFRTLYRNIYSLCISFPCNVFFDTAIFFAERIEVKSVIRRELVSQFEYKYEWKSH